MSDSLLDSLEPNIEIAFILVSLVVIFFSVWRLLSGFRIAVKQGGFSYVYHGTRLPMSVIIEHGIPALAEEDRDALFDVIAQALNDIGVVGLKREWQVELANVPMNSLSKGVYVCGKYNRARDFAIAAPAFVTDHIYALLKKAGYRGVQLDYAFLAILDRIGQPKVLECRIPIKRFISGQGEYGSVVDRILPEDIAEIHVISYNTPSEASRQAIDHLVNVAMERWSGDGVGRKELSHVCEGQG